MMNLFDSARFCLAEMVLIFGGLWHDDDDDDDDDDHNLTPVDSTQ